MNKIVFVRHGESEGNQAKIVTGRMDVPLTEIGRSQARETGKLLQGFTFDKAYTSGLRRAQDTLNVILNEIKQPKVPVTIASALDERDFGVMTGAPKAALQASLGKDHYHSIVKGWDAPAPNGESLRMVQARALPYFQETILAQARANKNILVVSHHQTLRALLKHILNIPDDKIQQLVLKNAQPIVCTYQPITDSLIEA